MKKRLFLLFIIAMILTGSQTVSATELKGGLLEPEVDKYPISTVTDDLPGADRDIETEMEIATDTSKWDKYTSMYYYNQLSPEYRKTWDELDVVCKSYFDASKTVTDTSGRLESVSLPTGMTGEELGIFWEMYVYSNPQFYFLKNSYSYTYASGDATQSPLSVRLKMYPAFYDGAVRAAETEKIEAILATWQSEIDACETDVEKLKKIQDLICTKVNYNYEKGLVTEEESFSQSAYSVFCMDLTVCAGYADAFSMLCNASGIDAISVTSDNHQWNKVRIDDSWYNCDPTWDDQGTKENNRIIYLYFARSDESYEEVIDAGDADAIYSHTMLSFWDEYRPLCTLDTNPTEWDEKPGTFPTITEQVATPEISFSYVDGEPQVTLSCDTANTDLYYTTDGTNPAVAKSKAYKYNAPFAAEIDTQIKVIAVCDTYLDSEVAAKVVELEKYAITYVLDGGVNSEENPANYTVRDEVVLQSPTKAGYKFLGWYLDETGTEQTTGIEAGSIGPCVFYALWSPITYSVSYDGNGATDGTMSVQSDCEYDVLYALEENNYERTGYIFSGWNTKSDSSGTEYSDGDEVENLTAINGETVILYAQWSPITYNISYDGNGAEDGAMSEHSGCKYDEEYKLFANAYVKKGYALKCWNTELDNSGTAFVDEALVKNLTATDGANVTLYAQWRLLEYSISYNGNGATAGSMAVKSGCKYDAEYVLDANDYERSGYTFAGWNTEADGSGAAYSDEAAIKNLAETDGATMTLYAQWSPITYGISFEGNGATDGTMSAQNDCEYEKEYELDSNNYTRIGYIFAGWNTKADGSGASYADEALVKNLATKTGATATLYAQWSPILYTIIYDGNGATGGEMEEQSGCAYDASVILKANAYVKAGNGFKSWNTKPDGSGMSYMDEASVKNLAMVHGETVTLYAQWGVGKYSISYDGNGATEGTMTVKKGCEYGVEYLLDANNYKRTGYIFAGWNTKADGSGTSYADASTVKSLTAADGETVTLYAQWSPITYKVVFDANGATSETMPSLVDCKYDTTYRLITNVYMRTGYTFAGWNTKADGSGTAYADFAQVKNLTNINGGVVVLYAQWRINTYTIRYDGNKSTKGSMSSQPSLVYGKSYQLLTNKFKRTGYKFTGWNTQKDGKGTSYKNMASVQNLSAVNGEVVTLYAQWKANTYKIKFNGNGATSGSMKKTKQISYGKKYRLSANKFKKDGYKFVGWNTKKNGKGKMYKNKAKIKDLTSKNGKTVTLYAQWKKI